MATRTRNLNPVHIGKDRVRLDLLDFEGKDAALNDDRFMKHYVVAIGWMSTRISRDGMRPFAGTPETNRPDPRYRGFLRNRRSELREIAEREGDMVLHFVDVFAHDRRDVVRFYAV